MATPRPGSPWPATPPSMPNATQGDVTPQEPALEQRIEDQAIRVVVPANLVNIADSDPDGWQTYADDLSARGSATRL